MFYLKFRICITTICFHFSCLPESCDFAFRSVVDLQPSAVYRKWQKHSQLLRDSDFSFQEPVMALRTVILELLMEKEVEDSRKGCFRDILTKHRVELSILARTFKNTQVVGQEPMSSHLLTFLLLPRR